MLTFSSQLKAGNKTKTKYSSCTLVKLKNWFGDKLALCLSNTYKCNYKMVF